MRQADGLHPLIRWSRVILATTLLWLVGPAVSEVAADRQVVTVAATATALAVRSERRPRAIGSVVLHETLPRPALAPGRADPRARKQGITRRVYLKNCALLR